MHLRETCGNRHLCRASADHVQGMQAGEGSYGQLVRRYGEEGAADVVRRLRCVWISHIHADHHAGLPRLLALRHRMLGDAAPPLPVRDSMQSHVLVSCMPHRPANGVILVQWVCAALPRLAPAVACLEAAGAAGCLASPWHDKVITCPLCNRSTGIRASQACSRHCCFAFTQPVLEVGDAIKNRSVVQHALMLKTGF